MAQVTILRRETGSQPEPSGISTPGLLVTYSTPLFPPRTVFIPGPKPTDAQVAEAIRKDMETVTAQRPTTLEI